jgi:ABC-type spermidine/putrescine transport system permease subunit I
MIFFATMIFSFIMSVFLFLIGYWEAIKISNEEGLVRGGTMIFCLIMGFVFAVFASTFSTSIA